MINSVFMQGFLAALIAGMVTGVGGLSYAGGLLLLAFGAVDV